MLRLSSAQNNQCLLSWIISTSAIRQRVENILNIWTRQVKQQRSLLGIITNPGCQYIQFKLTDPSIPALTKTASILVYVERFHPRQTTQHRRHDATSDDNTRSKHQTPLDKIYKVSGQAGRQPAVGSRLLPSPRRQVKCCHVCIDLMSPIKCKI